jgi:two-component system nitrogen regulation sensor histidine kinase NtrY
LSVFSWHLTLAAGALERLEEGQGIAMPQGNLTGKVTANGA